MKLMRPNRSRIGRILLPLIGVVTAGVLGTLAWSGLNVAQGLLDLLRENRELRQSIANLTETRRVGYARVLDQWHEGPQLHTRLLFVVTDDKDPTRRLLEREYVVAGDVVHFDALIVRFAPELVASGEAKALFLWRRVYGESQTPAEAFTIETPGEPPVRYAEITESLSLKERRLFWDEIWSLAADPDRLRDAGVDAVYGSAVYTKLRPGLIYELNLDATGAFYPSLVPAL